MNYPNYFPQSYYQNNYGYADNMTIPYKPQVQPQAPTQNNNSINWVQGESGAKSFLVAPNQSVLLMDAENSVFYIKSVDASGMPLPLRIFDYTERTQQPVSEPQIQAQAPTQEYITREEFESRLAELTQPKQATQQRKDKATS